MAATPTILPTATPVATPLATPVTQTLVVQQPQIQATPNLVDRIGQVDPLIWATLAGALVLPFVHSLVQRAAAWFNKSFSRQAKQGLLIVLSGLIGVLTNLNDAGVLAMLHNPLLAAGISAAVTFVAGNNVYQLFLKTNKELDDAKAIVDSLPVDTTP